MSVRQERVQEQLVQELSEMIRRDLRDPRIGFVTLTGAEITGDLRHAKVFVSIYGTAEEQKQTLKALNGASEFCAESSRGASTCGSHRISSFGSTKASRGDSGSSNCCTPSRAI